MKERSDQGGERVRVDQPDHCVACRSCELACSIHHLGAFRPSRSSVVIERDADSGVIERRLYLVDEGERIACDRCLEETEWQCEKYCARPSVRRIVEARTTDRRLDGTPSSDAVGSDDGAAR